MREGFTNQHTKILRSAFLFSNLIFASTKPTFGNVETQYITSTSVHVGSADFEYMVIWDEPVKEELRVTFNHSENTSSGKGVTLQGAGGLNICSPMDGNTVYGLFKSNVFEINFQRQTIKPIEPIEMKNKLVFLGRFEISDLMSPSQHRLIKFLKAPDIGSGPSEPCSLNAGS